MLPSEPVHRSSRTSRLPHNRRFVNDARPALRACVRAPQPGRYACLTTGSCTASLGCFMNKTFIPPFCLVSGSVMGQSHPDPAIGIWYAKWVFSLLPIALGLVFHLLTLWVRGHYRPREDSHLPLHRLSDADGIGLPDDGACAKCNVRFAHRATQDLRENGRKRHQARSRVLSQLRYADILGCDQRSAVLLATCRLSSTAGRVAPREAAVVQVCTSVGHEPAGDTANKPPVTSSSKQTIRQAKIRFAG